MVKRVVHWIMVGLYTAAWVLFGLIVSIALAALLALGAMLTHA